MSPDERLLRALQRCPLVAILRGVRPEEVSAVARALIEAGLTIIEVPMNSPRALESVGRLAELTSDVLIGAGTVTSIDQARGVRRAGGDLVVSPHTDPELIRACRSLDLISVPGVLSPSEAFQAIDAGADGLKLFPCQIASPAALGAMVQILPPETLVLAVGGIGLSDLAEYHRHGAAGFGIGGEIFRPGRPPDEIRRRAARLVAEAARLAHSGSSGPSR